MKIGDALKEMKKDKPFLEKEISETIIQKKDISIPNLVRYLEKPIFNDKEPLGTMYATYFLAYFNYERTFVLIDNILSMDEKKIDKLYNHNHMGADLGKIIARVVDDTGIIINRVTDENYKGIKYHFMIDALKSLVVNEKVSFNLLIETLSRALDSIKGNRINLIASTCLSLHVEELFSKIIKLGENVPILYNKKDFLDEKFFSSRKIAIQKIKYDDDIFSDLVNYLSETPSTMYKSIIKKEIYGIGVDNIVYKCLKCKKEFLVPSNEIINPLDKVKNNELIYFKCPKCNKEGLPILAYKRKDE